MAEGERASRWGLVAWSGIGMVVAGAGVVGWALLFGERSSLSGRALDPDPEGPVAALGVVVVAAAVVAGLRLVLAWRPRRDWPGDTSWPVWVWVLGLGIAGCGWWLFSIWRTVVESGFPGDRVLLELAGATAVLLGLIVVAVAFWHEERIPAPRSRRALLAVCVGVTTVAVASAGTAVVADAAMVDQTTAAAVEPASVPDSPTGQRWRWDGAPIGEHEPVVATGAGVVTFTEDGTMVAIDGRTGKERWHYRRDEVGVSVLGAMPDGSGVVVSLEGMVHVFDAFTGELWWRDEARRLDPSSWVLPLMTESTLIEPTGVAPAGAIGYVGLDARTGKQIWRYDLPADCASPHTRASKRTVVMLIHCPENDHTLGAAAVDGATGKELWRHTEGFGSGNLEMIGDGAVATNTGDAQGRYAGKAALDERTGRLIAKTETSVGVVHTSVDPTTLDAITGDGLVREGEDPWVALHRIGEPEARWRITAELVDDEYIRYDLPGHDGVAALGDNAVALLTTDCRITVHDRTTGAERASLEGCASAMVAAPGALVAKLGDQLLGFA